MYDFFAKIIDSLNHSDLPKYQKFNLISSAIIAVVILALALPPVLAWVNNILISIGNIFIIIFGKAEHTQEINTSVSVTIIIPLLILLGETIICHIFCCVAAKNNKPHDGDEK